MTATPSDPPAPSPGTRCWTLFAADGAVDVELTAPDSASLGSVLPALSRALGVPVDGIWDGSVRLPEDLPISVPTLAHGALLGLGRPVPPAWRARRSSALELHVVGGPEAGRTLPLGQGRHVLGRGSEATVVVEDPDVSRRHVAVQVGGGRITVADLCSTNGSRLGDVELDAEPRPWPVGAVLRLGGTAMTIAGPGQSSASLAAGPGGRHRLRPSPRLEPPIPDVEVAFPRAPEPPPSRRLAWAAIALPAVAGVLMAWLLGAPTFLFFALLSPVVALGTWLSERWTGRRTGRRTAASHAVEVLAADTRLDEAVRAHVGALQRTHPDLATLTAAARRRADVLWSRTLGASGALGVRLGTGTGPTGVTRVDGDGTRRRQTAPDAPVVVDLARDGGLAVIGPVDVATGVLRAVVAQLTALHPPGQVELILLADTAGLARWAWARWLPHLSPSSVHVQAHGRPEADDELLRRFSALLAARRSAAERTAGPPRSQAVVIVDRPLDPRLVALLREARDAGVAVLTSAVSADTLPVGLAVSFRLTGETGDAAVLSRNGLTDVHVAAVDRLPPATAARFARDLAALAPADTVGILPRAVRLLELPSAGVGFAADGLTGSWSRSRDRLQVAVGRTADGPYAVDLVRSGPHVLVAGTTGSGKSELLQTLIAGLALAHPPDRCSFLLVDYKGGAAFAEAAALPHAVGVVTDLDGQTTARALRSLTAELARRESILAAHRVPEIAALPDEVELARLVIVVDEFATLAEELPSFVPGLVSIAQRGRSLGVHLVLATQRPSGVVSPEIRANCTLRICLRTTDEADSRDVLGTPSAAHLPIDVPGRAYVRVGSAEPTAVQVARVAATAPPATADGPRVRRWTWPVHAADPAPESPGPTDLARLTAAIEQHTAATGARRPHRPWCAPLPDRLTAPELPQSTTAAVLPLGLVDLPDTQSQAALELDLAMGGTWLVIGGPGSGRSTVLRTVLREAVTRSGPDDLHVHVIETGGGSLGEEAAALPHTGTVISGADHLRTARLVERLADQVATRRAGPGSGAAPRILLLVDGIEELTTILEDADPGHGSTTLSRLLRDGAAAGLTCVVTADRAVPGGRLAALARQRLVLPLPDRADYAVAGVPPRAVPGHRPPGRALVGEDALECQLALPREPAHDAAHPPRTGPAPLRIPELPVDPALPLPSAPIATSDRALLLPIGPGGDDGAALTVDLARTGGLLVAGPPGSGRTAALDAFVRHLLAAGVPVLRLGDPPSAPPPAGDALERWADPADAAAVRTWMASLPSGTGVLVADDVATPTDHAALSAVAATAGPGRTALIAAGHAAQLSAHYQGPIAALRRARVGLLLCPGPGDAELLGIRLPRTPLPVRAGAGWLVSGSRTERVQVARHRGHGPS